MTKKIAIVGATGSYTIGKAISEACMEHDSISPVIIIDNSHGIMAKEQQMENELAAAMMLGMTAKMSKYGNPQGSNKTPKKKKRKKNKKTHRG